MKTDKEEYIERLDKIERDLQWIIQYLLVANKPVDPPPYVPRRDEFGPPQVQVPYGITCSKCGKIRSGVEAYLCPNADCPVQIKAT